MPSLWDIKRRTHLSCFGYYLVKFCLYLVVCCLVTKSRLTLQCHGLYVAHQTLLSVGFPRQEYYSGLSFSSPGDLLNPEIEFTSFVLAGGFFTTESPGKVCHSFPFNFMAAVTICSDFGTPKNIVCPCFPSICSEVMGPNAMILVFWMSSFQPGISLSSFIFKRLFSFFTFHHKGGVICISEVVDVYHGSLDSSLWFIHPSISHDVLCI